MLAVLFVLLASTATLTTGCDDARNEIRAKLGLEPVEDGAEEAEAQAAAEDVIKAAKREINMVYAGQRLRDGKPYFTGGSTGAVIELEPNDSGEPSVAVSERIANGTGNSLRSSVWMGAFISSRLAGHDLTDYEFLVVSKGEGDGPSAGGLLTSAMLAAMNDVEVDPEATMTGTINPDGTIGPVGGIPHKLKGVSKSKKRFGYPVGQRMSTDYNTRKNVDIDKLARRYDMEAVEIRDIYEAYEFLTGEKFERPDPVSRSDMRASDRVWTLLKSKTNKWISQAKGDIGRAAQNKRMRRALGAMYKEAQGLIDQAEKYSDQSMVSMAYQKAQEARVFTSVLLTASEMGSDFLRGDLESIKLEQFAASGADSNLQDFFVQLNQENPTTLAQALALVSAYTYAVDGWAMIRLAHKEHREAMQLNKAANNRKLSRKKRKKAESKSRMAILKSAMYFGLADVVIEAGKETMVIPDDGGERVDFEVDKLHELARAYSSAAAANLENLNSTVLESRAKRLGLSREVIEHHTAEGNIEYAIADLQADFAYNESYRNEQNIDEGINSALASLAAGLNSYLTSSKLVTEWYSLKVKKKDGDVVEIGEQAAFISMLELAEQKARETAAAAKQKAGLIPDAARINYQQARGARQASSKDEQLGALGSFWKSSAYSQLALELNRAVESEPKKGKKEGEAVAAE